MSPLRPSPESRMDAGVADCQCRGEDSNLCSIGERDLPVGHPLRHGLELTLGLGGLMVLASVFTGHTIALAGLVGFVIAGNARRRPARPRTVVATLTEGQEPCEPA